MGRTPPLTSPRSEQSARRRRQVTRQAQGRASESREATRRAPRGDDREGEREHGVGGAKEEKERERTAGGERVDGDAGDRETRSVRGGGGGGGGAGESGGAEDLVHETGGRVMTSLGNERGEGGAGGRGTESAGVGARTSDREAEGGVKTLRPPAGVAAGGGLKRDVG